MSRRLSNRIGQLEARQAGGVDQEKFARERAKQEKIKECARENREGYVRYQDAIDGVLEAIEEARVRSETTGEDPEDAPEVQEAILAYEQIERLLLGEDDEGRRQ